MKSDDPLKGVFVKDGRYYLVIAQGKRRIWHGLTRVDLGLPAMLIALGEKKAELEREVSTTDFMPQVVADWELEVMPRHAEKTQIMDRFYNRVIADAFVDFRAELMDGPSCKEFLNQFSHMPRTYNGYRGHLREILRFAAEKGLRAPGTNPIDDVLTMKNPPRSRCPTSSEIRRVKLGCLYGDDGLRTRSGMTMSCLIEMLYLTGQDVSVAIRVLEQRDPMRPGEPHVRPDGIFFQRDKTGGTVVILWTPRLRAVIDRLRAMKAERLLRKRADQRVVTPYLFTKQDGTPLNYEAVANAWQRGIKRAKVAHFMLRDIRAAAMTDKESKDGMREASAMGAHATESQTADYVRRRKARKTGATR